MQLARTIARVLVGLLFVLAGVVPFLMAPPPQPGLAGVVNDALYRSHWSQFVGFAQIVIGALLLANRYVPLALMMLFAFLYNSFAYHIGTSPIALPLPILVTGLAIFIGWPYRRAFSAFFRAKPEAAERP